MSRLTKEGLVDLVRKRIRLVSVEDLENYLS